jgi:hypothetical protein
MGPGQSSALNSVVDRVLFETNLERSRDKGQSMSVCIAGEGLLLHSD